MGEWQTEPQTPADRVVAAMAIAGHKMAVALGIECEVAIVFTAGESSVLGAWNTEGCEHWTSQSLMESLLVAAGVAARQSGVDLAVIPGSVGGQG